MEFYDNSGATTVYHGLKSLSHGYWRIFQETLCKWRNQMTQIEPRGGVDDVHHSLQIVDLELSIHV